MSGILFLTKALGMIHPRPANGLRGWPRFEREKRLAKGWDKEKGGILQPYQEKTRRKNPPTTPLSHSVTGITRNQLNSVVKVCLVDCTEQDKQNMFLFDKNKNVDEDQKLMYSQLTLVFKKQEFSKIGNKVFIPTGVQTYFQRLNRLKYILSQWSLETNASSRSKNVVIKNYSTSCDPHHDMSGRIFGHIFSIF